MRDKILTWFWGIVICQILSGCFSKSTSDPEEVYYCWLGEEPPDSMIFIKGHYWQSAHWTKEYKVHLIFKPGNVWWDAFIKQNFLPVDKGKWVLHSDAPDWFRPPDRCVRYGIADDFDQGSRYFSDTLTGICYIYEIQL